MLRRWRFQGNRGFGLGAVGPETRDDMAAIERTFGRVRLATPSETTRLVETGPAKTLP